MIRSRAGRLALTAGDISEREFEKATIGLERTKIDGERGNEETIKMALLHRNGERRQVKCP